MIEIDQIRQFPAPVCCGTAPRGALRNHVATRTLEKTNDRPGHSITGEMTVIRVVHTTAIAIALCLSSSEGAEALAANIASFGP
jgi:hypothetical protein